MPENLQSDVVIVGAGPGGSLCARECAKLGLKTLVVDRRQEIGTPVRCGEGLSLHWMKDMQLDYDPMWCLQESKGAIVHSPKGKKFEIKVGEQSKGYVIERKEFEKKLAMQAIRKGAKYLLKSTVYDVIKDDSGTLKGVKVENQDGKFEIYAKIVVAADGVDSMTAKYAGLKTFNPITEVDSGFEYEMAGLKIDSPDLIHLYINQDIAERGYVWIFPKGKDIANVGIGIIGNKKDQTAKGQLDKFIQMHPEIFERAGIVEIKGGCIPVGAPIEKPYAAGLLIIGDAAHMVNAIHGGGMGSAMEAGMLAAQYAKKAIDANDFSESFLSKFGEEWYEIRGNKLLQVLKVRKFFEKLSDDDLEKLAEMLDEKTLFELSKGSKLKMFIKLFAKHPKIALIAAKTLA